jgi:spermidine synthase
MTRWFSENEDHGVGLRVKVEHVLYEGRTSFQDMIIFESSTFGRVLALDGVIQTSERDEFIYHEMIVHVPIFAHGSARRILIVGGGDGGALREVLKHDVEQVVVVDIDSEVVSLCRRFMPALSAGAFDDPRTRLIINDAASFVAECRDRYDVILVDSTDPVPTGPGQVLFAGDFYANCWRLLSSNGIMVAQYGIPFLHLDALRNGRMKLAAIFPDVAFYIVAVPLFVGGYMAFAWAATDPMLRAQSGEALRRRFVESGIATRWYSPEFHKACFLLPSSLVQVA